MSAIVVNAVAVKVSLGYVSNKVSSAYFTAYAVLGDGNGSYKPYTENAFIKRVGVTPDSFKYVKDDKVVSTPLDFVEGHTFVCSTSRNGISVPKEVEGSFKSMLELFVMDVTKSNRLLKAFESTQLREYDDVVINGLATVL